MHKWNSPKFYWSKCSKSYQPLQNFIKKYFYHVMLTIFYINSVWFYVEYKCWNDVWRINAGAKRKKSVQRHKLSALNLMMKRKTEIESTQSIQCGGSVVLCTKDVAMGMCPCQKILAYSQSSFQAILNGIILHTMTWLSIGFNQLKTK